MLERIEFESFWLGSAAFADAFVGREAIQGLQPSSVVVGGDEVGKMSFELIMSVVMVADSDFDLSGKTVAGCQHARFLDRAVHALDLAIGPRMFNLGQPMFDPVLLAAHIEHMSYVSCRRAARVTRREGELDPIVSEIRVDLVGDSHDQSFEEGRG